MEDEWELPELPDGSMLIHPDDYERLCRDAALWAQVRDAVVRHCDGDLRQDAAVATQDELLAFVLSIAAALEAEREG